MDGEHEMDGLMDGWTDGSVGHWNAAVAASDAGGGGAFVVVDWLKRSILFLPSFAERTLTRPPFNECTTALP